MKKLPDRLKKREKISTTYRLEKSILQDFHFICDKQEAVRTSVVEWLLEEFIKENLKVLPEGKRKKYK